MKLAAAALSLVLIVPGLAQSQPLAPPRLLYPGESPPSVPPPTPGSYPSATEPLGYEHPECLSVYGKTPAQIEATPCGVTENIAANSTVSACYHNNVIDFQGDNITVDCVKWYAGIAFFGTRCENAAGCKNIKILRSTITGNNGVGPYGQNQSLLRFMSPKTSVLIEKNDISQSDVFVYAGDAIKGDTFPFPGEGNFALILRGNRFHHLTQTPGSHTDGLYFANDSRGILTENNLITAVGTSPSVNWGSSIQDQVSNSSAGNHVFRNNHIITDTTDVALNFGPNVNGSCASPIQWINNKVDLRSPTLFGYAHGSIFCPTLGFDPNHVCTGNTFENGSPQKCSSNGL